ncbi:Smr (Small MutS Related) domain-containing protein [Salix suchowensis]|nr:Smr (Small MutS Related) domain-containing protein [Salix suchowensis]
MNNRSRRVKSSGWAAFDLKQRQKDGEGDGKDPFPAIGDLPSFSSVLQPPASPGFPTVKTQNVNNLTATVADFSAGYRNFDKVIEEKNDGNVLLDLKSLKEIHGWADFSLIEDVMSSVDNDAAKAFVLLNEMVSNADFDEDEGAKFNSGFNKSLADDIADLSSTLEDALKYNDHNNDKNNIELREDVGVSSSVDAAANMKLILGHLKSIPVEPEWEEDDLYLSHRKNALRMMRLASRHSRAATNAFLRRDHSSAQQHSLRAQEKWSAAEQLNAQAAKEILSIRNSGNDPWKLDLHGLHAGEATLVPNNRSTSPCRIKTKNGIIHSPPFDGFRTVDAENLDKQQAALRQRRTSVQVITGVGNHSRGQAALPTAVKSFLNDNGYRFDETRPGMITVRPKFRRR